MNVTLKLPDDLCRRARHSAIDEDKSLSAWVAELVLRKLDEPPPEQGKTLLEILGHPESADRDFPLPDRNETRHRSIEFP